jgi:hypothetical protein
MMVMAFSILVGRRIDVEASELVRENDQSSGEEKAGDEPFRCWRYRPWKAFCTKMMVCVEAMTQASENFSILHPVFGFRWAGVTFFFWISALRR